MTRVLTKSRLTLGASVALLLAGCAVGPDYSRPELPVPERWSQTSDAATRPSSDSSRGLDLRRWWDGMDDPVLSSLIGRSIDANPDLEAARARLESARAQMRAVGAELLPNVDAIGSLTHNRGSGNGPAGAPGARLESNQYQAGFDASWELDVFGSVRRGVEAARADLDAAHADRDDVRVSVTAEVARDYLALRSIQRRLDIARQNIAAQKDALSLASSRYEAGLTTDLDATQARALLATTQAQVPSLEAVERQTMHALAALLGLEPGALVKELAARPQADQAGGGEVTIRMPAPIGLPSDLLRRRPDVRRAERRLAAATARVGQATADLYPRFFLTGSAGLQSLEAGDFFAGNSRFYSIGPQVRWPILNFGRVQAQVDVSQAKNKEALANYRKSVLLALTDVENALVAYYKEQDRRTSLTEALEADRLSLELATQQYQRGLVAYLTVIDAQRQVYAAEDQLAQSDLATGQNLVALFKALGGGWDASDRPTHSAAADATPASR